MEVIVEPVSHIPRTAGGKFQAVVSLLRDQGVPEAEQTGLGPDSGRERDGGPPGE